MELIAIAPQDLLDIEQWKQLKDNFSRIVFVERDNLDKFDYNLTNEEKSLLLDPDYFDWALPKNLIKSIKNLKNVCLTTTTASYVDEKYLSENDIKLLTIPKYSTNSVAEYLVFLMFCLAKKLPLQMKNQNRQDFSNEYIQMELTGKTAGVVGLGNIGKRICEITKGIGMKPIYWNRTAKESEFQSSDLPTLFKEADVIFITLANNPSTKNIVTDNLLKLMKKTAILISGTGVELHNDKLIRKMLLEGDLFGFGAELPNKSINDYEGNAMITSEYAWFTEEATKKRKQIIFENLYSLNK